MPLNTSFPLTVGFKTAFPIPKEVVEGNHPVIVLAHGTAITPFMSVFNEIAQYKSASIIFIYGIRAFEHDFLFKDELEPLFEKFGPTSEVHVC